MKKIAVFNYDTSSNPWAGGGASEYNFQLFKHLSSKYDITIYGAGTPEFTEPVEIDGLTYAPLSSSIAYKNSKFSYLWTVIRNLGRIEADLIIENWFYPFPLGLQFFTKRPVILICHGTYGKHSIHKFGLLGVPTLLIEMFYRLAYKRVITVSPTSLKEFRTNSKVLTPPGLNEEFLQVSPTYKPDAYIAMLSRIDIYQKGLDIVRELAPKINREIRIAGDGHRLEKFKRSVKADNIVFVGRKTGQEKISFLQNSSFFLMPSRYEGFGISGLEAQACGKPVVGFDVNDLNFCVKKDYSGLLAKPYNKIQLLSAITKLSNNPELIRTLGRNAHNHAKTFSYKKSAESLAEFIEKMAAGD